MNEEIKSKEDCKYFGSRTINKPCGHCYKNCVYSNKKCDNCILYHTVACPPSSYCESNGKEYFTTEENEAIRFAYCMGLWNSLSLYEPDTNNIRKEITSIYPSFFEKLKGNK